MNLQLLITVAALGSFSTRVFVQSITTDSVQLEATTGDTEYGSSTEDAMTSTSDSGNGVYTEDDLVSNAGYTAEVTDTGSQESVVIYDSEGNAVSHIYIPKEEGYQLEIPADWSVCLYRQAEPGTNCYREEAVTETLPSEVLEKCAGRDVRLLIPVSCDEEPVTVTTPEPDEPMIFIHPLPPVWSTCCSWRYAVSRRCVARDCCRRFLGFCIRRCCMMYIYQIIWMQNCTSGFEQPVSIP